MSRSILFVVLLGLVARPDSFPPLDRDNAYEQRHALSISVSSALVSTDDVTEMAEALGIVETHRLAGVTNVVLNRALVGSDIANAVVEDRDMYVWQIAARALIRIGPNVQRAVVQRLNTLEASDVAAMDRYLWVLFNIQYEASMESPREALESTGRIIERFVDDKEARSAMIYRIWEKDWIASCARPPRD